MHIPKACYDVAIDGDSRMCSTHCASAGTWSDHVPRNESCGRVRMSERST